MVVFVYYKYNSISIMHFRRRYDRAFIFTIVFLVLFSIALKVIPYRGK